MELLSSYTIDYLRSRVVLGINAPERRASTRNCILLGRNRTLLLKCEVRELERSSAPQPQLCQVVEPTIQ